MSKKQPLPPPAPPSSSSSDEEEEYSSDDEEPITNSPNPQTPIKIKQQEDEEEETDDEDSQSASDSDEGDDEDDTNKPQSSISTPATLELKPCDAGENSNAKSNASTNVKALFQRIWSLDDEIAILKAMAEFEPKHGTIKLNAAGVRDFHDFVKASLSLEVNGTQLYEKIRRLKKKYESVAARVKNGKTVKFAKPHDEKVYELSKGIWKMGDSAEVKSEVKVVKSKKKVAAVADDGGGSLKREYYVDGGRSLKREYPFLKQAMSNMRCGISTEVLEMLDPKKASSLENMFKKQKVVEINNKMHEIDLTKEALKMVLEDIEKTMD